MPRLAGSFASGRGETLIARVGRAADGRVRRVIGPGFRRMTARDGLSGRTFRSCWNRDANMAARRRWTTRSALSGHETALHRLDGHGVPAWMEEVVSVMTRNSATVASVFRLPREGVVEIGRQVEI